MSRFLKSAAVAAMMLAASSPAQAQLVAAPADCTDFNVLAIMGASACSGAWVGNINNQTADVNAELTSTFGGTYTLLGYSNGANNGPFSNGPTANAGTLNFDGSVTGSIILGLKAGNAFSFYQFDNLIAATSVNYDTRGVQANGNDIGAGLSHAALYYDPSDGTVITQSVVPEPSTYAMMIGGLLAMGVAARRRRNA